MCLYRWKVKIAVRVAASVVLVLLVGLVGQATWLGIRAMRQNKKASALDSTFSTFSATTVSARLTTGELQTMRT